MSLSLFPGWYEPAGDPSAQQVARELVDRHYPRQTAGSNQYAPPGRRWALVVNDASGCALWVVCENLEPGDAGVRQFRCTVFRNESSHRSSELIVDATARTYARWSARGWLAAAPPLRTEVDPAKVRRKRDPGRCFRKAGWREVGTHHRRREARSRRPPDLRGTTVRGVGVTLSSPTTIRSRCSRSGGRARGSSRDHGSGILAHRSQYHPT